MNIQPSLQPVQFGMRRARLALGAAGLMTIALTACGGSDRTSAPATDSPAAVSTAPAETLQPEEDVYVPQKCAANLKAQQALACEAENIASEMDTRGLSAQGVNDTVDKVYGVRVFGNANQLADQYRDLKTKEGKPYFEEVKDYTANDLNTRAGWLVIVPPGQGANPEYGDAFITLGDGRIASDHVQTNYAADRPDLIVFKPVLPPGKN